MTEKQTPAHSLYLSKENLWPLYYRSQVGQALQSTVMLDKIYSALYDSREGAITCATLTNQDISNCVNYDLLLFVKGTVAFSLI